MTLGELYDRLKELESGTCELERLRSLRSVGQSSDDAVRELQYHVDALRDMDLPL